MSSRGAATAAAIFLVQCTALRPGTDRADAALDAPAQDVLAPMDHVEVAHVEDDVVEVATQDVAPDVVTPTDAPDAVDVTLPTDPSILAPQPIAPLSGSAIASAQPIVSWLLPAGTSAAIIELCSDRNCTTLLQPAQSQPLAASQGMLSGVARGVVFWRLRGRTQSAMGTDTSPTWEMINDSPGTPTGAVQPSLLDVNGDGIADVLVGAPTASDGASHGGEALLYVGNSGSPPPTLDARFTIPGPMSTDRLGQRVAIVGDVDGDGFADALVASACGTYYDSMASPLACGSSATQLAYGSAAGFTVVTGPSGMASNQYGQSIAGGGDINGDGRADMIIGIPGNNQVLLVGVTPTVRTLYTARVGFTSMNLSGYGWVVANAGDVDGDGLDDVLVGAPNAFGNIGYAFVIFGNDAWTSATTPTFNQIEIPNPAGSGQGFGGGLAGVGDVNKDGYGDFVVGSYAVYSSGGGGSAYLYLGGPTISQGVGTPISLPSSGTMNFGSAVSGAGDLNNDGYADFAVASNGTQTYSDGAVTVFYGGRTPPAMQTVLTNTHAAAVDGRMGDSLAAAGDVDGDGFGDLVVAAPTAILVPGPGGPPPPGPGAVAIYRGGPSGIRDTPLLLTLPSGLGTTATFGGSAQ